ncbi:hypothetical protein DAEQUDRAFT_361683 [Daedalea quercina L-15889]|uniref:Uncharacterized protein n=1 Tax=Daedalea quercina L-15889 TaxID=1314783 RepID=A0A165TTR2_9APHY|nr:hypothetical protein DAEQUDRAFT_361683 [Daedalea quercina L-15889]
MSIPAFHPRICRSMVRWATAIWTMRNLRRTQREVGLLQATALRSGTVMQLDAPQNEQSITEWERQSIEVILSSTMKSSAQTLLTRYRVRCATLKHVEVRVLRPTKVLASCDMSFIQSMCSYIPQSVMCTPSCTITTPCVRLNQARTPDVRFRQ